MSKTSKIAFLSVFVLLFTANTITGLAFLNQISDDVGDVRRFDFEFYDSFEADFDDADHIKDDLDDLIKGFQENWYDETIATTLTSSELEDFGHCDAKEIRGEKMGEEIGDFYVILNNDFDHASRNNLSWACAIWTNPSDSANQMVYIFGYSGVLDYFYALDIINEEAYNVDYNKDTCELKAEINSESWNDENMQFFSFGNYKSETDSDIIVDINPNATNFGLIYAWIIIVLIMLVMLIAVIYLYKKYH
jgi:hypothetical protein